MKKAISIALVLAMAVSFTACGKENAPINVPSSAPVSSENSSEAIDKMISSVSDTSVSSQNTLPKPQSQFNTKDVTMSENVVESISDRAQWLINSGDVTYDFDSPKKISPKGIMAYVSIASHSYPFYDNALNQAHLPSGEGHITLYYNDIMAILKKEMLLNELPFSVENKENIFTADITVGDYNFIKMDSIIQKDDEFKIIVTQAPRYNGQWFDLTDSGFQDESGNKIANWQYDHFKPANISVKMEYTFGLTSDNFPILKSGKRL